MSGDEKRETGAAGFELTAREREIVELARQQIEKMKTLPPADPALQARINSELGVDDHDGATTKPGA
ncbi:MAG: hypothetical protein ACR652_18895 [Methylocystis sp.]|uniref:hypothetical protein n=1 Tax=Methylocystis sp. TaxID=1911079 RepID=UPI003DA21F25